LHCIVLELYIVYYTLLRASLQGLNHQDIRFRRTTREDNDIDIILHYIYIFIISPIIYLGMSGLESVQTMLLLLLLCVRHNNTDTGICIYLQITVDYPANNDSKILNLYRYLSVFYRFTCRYTWNFCL